MKAPKGARKIKEQAIVALESQLYTWIASDLATPADEEGMGDGVYSIPEAIAAGSLAVDAYLSQFDVKLVRR
jgi:hypothetical protein